MYLKTPLNKPLLDALKKHVYPEFASHFTQPEPETTVVEVNEPVTNPAKTTKKSSSK